MAWFSRADAKGLASQLLDLTMPSELARAIHHVQSGYFITYFDEIFIATAQLWCPHLLNFKRRFQRL